MGTKYRVLPFLVAWLCCKISFAGPLTNSTGLSYSSARSEASSETTPKPHGLDQHPSRFAELEEKPHVVHRTSQDPKSNLPEKAQVVNTINADTGRLRGNDRKLYPQRIDTASKTEERPQVPPRVPLDPRPYGEPESVPQIPLPHNKTQVQFSPHPKPPAQYKPETRPTFPWRPAFSKPPHGYGFPLGNVQIPPTPKPPGCFYKSERYEHGDSVATPEPCLNCTCQKGVLVCYLRVCSPVGTPAPGCFTAREAGECCPNVFCSGDKKTETTTTPPPPLDDDYYDYSATVDYSSDSGYTTSKSQPSKRPPSGGYDDSELSARTPSIVEIDTATPKVETTTLYISPNTRATTQWEPSTIERTSTTATMTKVTVTTSAETVTAASITTTREPYLATTTFLSNDGTTRDDPETSTTTPVSSRAQEPTTFYTTSETNLKEPITTEGNIETTQHSEDSTEETKTTTELPVTTESLSVSTASVSGKTNSAEDTSTTRQTKGPGTPFKELVAEDEPANSVETGPQQGKDSIMLVSSTPLPFELHHTFDFQDLNTISGAQGMPNATTELPLPATTSTTNAESAMSTGSTSTGTTVQVPVIIPIQGCWKKGQLYKVGEAIPGMTDCESCHCTQRGPTCHRIECPPVALDCDPVIPRGHCCPTEYICNKTSLYNNQEYNKPAIFNKDLYHPQPLPDDYQDNQPLARKSDDSFDYNAVPQPAYRPPMDLETTILHDPNSTTESKNLTGKVPPGSTKRDNVLTSLHLAVTTNDSTLSTTAIKSPDDKNPTYSETNPLQTPLETSTNNSTEDSQSIWSSLTTRAPHKNHVIYIPELIHTKDGGKLMTEIKIEMKPAPQSFLPSHPFHQEKVENQSYNFFAREPLHDGNVQDKPSTQTPPPEDLPKGLPPVPLEGLQFSELIDRLFFTGSEDESTDTNKESSGDELGAVYGQAHLYNASGMGTSVIEARYPVKENDTLQPVYSSPPFLHKHGPGLGIEETESLKPRYGQPPSFEEESPAEMFPQMHTQPSPTPEVHYEAALSLDTDISSGSNASTNGSTKEPFRNPPALPSYQEQHEKAPEAQFLPKDVAGSYGEYSQAFMPSTRPSPVYYEQSMQMPNSAWQVNPKETSHNGVGAHSTPQPNMATHDDRVLKDDPHDHDNPAKLFFPPMDETNVSTSTNPSEANTAGESLGSTWWKTYFNNSAPTQTPEHKGLTNAPNILVENMTGSAQQREESSVTTSMIKVRVGNTMNVTVDQNQSKYRNVEEDGIIVSMFPEHRMDIRLTEVQDTSHLAQEHSDQIESRAISSRGPVKAVQTTEGKVKPTHLTEVISDIIKTQKGEEPEVITAPNIDFSKMGTMNIQVSPGNAFKVFSSVVLDSASKAHHTTKSTEAPLDTAPWAPIGATGSADGMTNTDDKHKDASSAPTMAEIFVSQASSTMQTRRLPTSPALDNMDQPYKPTVVHSSFRIVPFLAEDAIFKPAVPTYGSTNETSPKITPNSNPREPVKDNCFFGGRMFVNGELIRKEDPCELCRCYYGRELCQQRNCPLPPSPACISEKAPGFCCPKYTCRPEDVILRPDGDTPPPDNVIQYNLNNARSTQPPSRFTPVNTGTKQNKKPAAPSSRYDTDEATPATPFATPNNSPVFRPFFITRPPTQITTSNSGSANTKAAMEKRLDDAMETMSPAVPSSEPQQQLWNVFQVSGCNIYGKLYGVNEVVRELSSKCKACTCTSLGVQCSHTC